MGYKCTDNGLLSALNLQVGLHMFSMYLDTYHVQDSFAGLGGKPDSAVSVASSHSSSKVWILD